MNNKMDHLEKMCMYRNLHKDMSNKVDIIMHRLEELKIRRSKLEAKSKANKNNDSQVFENFRDELNALEFRSKLLHLQLQDTYKIKDSVKHKVDVLNCKCRGLKGELIISAAAKFVRRKYEKCPKTFTWKIDGVNEMMKNAISVAKSDTFCFMDYLLDVQVELQIINRNVYLAIKFLKDDCKRKWQKLPLDILPAVNFTLKDVINRSKNIKRQSAYVFEDEIFFNMDSYCSVFVLNKNVKKSKVQPKSVAALTTFTN
ncbi:hypothetical protein CHUAL_006352 [Chamberlinius hualienensis]